ncbi:MAG: prepilin-type N-terminal cleavage/methylation domain-containing protein [Burkholderiales bacterium]|nr:prepilin-type N-terminal cleavage/methylation domain-containing protein [Burkholderiales bacterium]
MAMPRSARPEGFTLVEIAVVIVVLSLLLAMMAGIATAMLGQQRREATRQRLAGVETALALFVSQNRRLPCPGDGRVDGANATAGIEERGAGGVCQVGGGANPNTQTHGVVPWRTLGLAEPDATDGWGNRLSYRVAPELAIDNAMDLTACDPGGSGPLSAGFCNPTTGATPCSSSTFPAGCTPPTTYTAGKGLKIRNLSSATLIMDPSTPVSTGAAYIVISHGENGAGSYNSQGILQAGATASGTLEGANNACNVVFTGANSGATPPLVDDFPSYAEGTGHFDDFVLRPSILAVATKAQLGPRAH